MYWTLSVADSGNPSSRPKIGLGQGPRKRESNATAPNTPRRKTGARGVAHISVHARAPRRITAGQIEPPTHENTTQSGNKLETYRTRQWTESFGMLGDHAELRILG